MYTSLTGFSSQDSAGSVQLAALGRMLCTLGFSMWDLGMDMDYKQTLGAHLMPREEFLAHIHSVRTTKGHLVLPPPNAVFNCKTLIDQEMPADSLVAGATETEPADTEKQDSNKPKGDTQRSTASHSPPPPSQGGSPEPNRKKRRNKSPVYQSESATC